MNARNVMTKTLITCSPETAISAVARLMRNRDTGNVLVIDEGKLVGIVTDRDIALRVTAKSLDPDQVSARQVMSTHLRTGEPNWDLKTIGKEMGKHQIRRLPIADRGVPVGIVSLSDLALHNGNKSQVTKSLKEISESRGTHRMHSVEHGLFRVILGLGLVIGAAVGLNWIKPSGNLWEHLQDSQIRDRLLDLVETGRAKMTAALSNS